MQSNQQFFQNVKDINNSIGSDDYLLIDSAYIFQHEGGAPNYYDVCKFIDENIDCKKVIVFILILESVDMMVM